MNEHLPALIRRGMTSFKVYMTYDRLKLDDYQLLDVLSLADREGALVMVHAENNDMIRWIAKRLLERGHVAPRFHVVSHDPLAEAEAAQRAIALSRLVDVPLLIVHVSGIEAARAIRAAQSLGARVYAETCPQYLFLTAADVDRPGLEGAMFCCSPPPRDAASQQAIWEGLANGTFQVFSSDHAPYRYDASGKLPKGDATTFKDMANGVPGIELRMPLLFSEGRRQGTPRASTSSSRSTSTNHARMYGLLRAQGHARGRRRRRCRALESRSEGRDHVVDAPRQRGLHPLRRPHAPRLAGDRPQPRARGHRGGRAARRARLRAIHSARRTGTRRTAAGADGGDASVQVTHQLRSMRIAMTRKLNLAVAQMGPSTSPTRARAVVQRLLAMLREAKGRGAEFVVFPELALTTFFPRYWMTGQEEIDRFFEREMPNAATPAALRRGEETRASGSIWATRSSTRQTATAFNTVAPRRPAGQIVGRYRKIHLPGHADHKPAAPFQHLEKRYFEVGNEGFKVWRDDGRDRSACASATTGAGPRPFA